MIKISVFGAVQGVGFRPFIYKLATSLELKGEVYNDAEGVKIFLDTSLENSKNFISLMKKSLPPLAKISNLEVLELPHASNYQNFSITKSKSGLKFSQILPDFAICDECRAEFYDPKNHRFHYPFINCTNCGPRISIVKNLPYDRKNTSMDEFKMCEICKSEYENPISRRFHAEPLSCKNCSPTIFLQKTELKNLDAIKEVANLIKQGKIIAIKGLGGFHLVCNAVDKNAINALRSRKNRPTKPFAVMVKDIKMARDFAEISADEESLLLSKTAPIVLLKSRGNLPLALAPNTAKIGIFIAPTSLHLLLFEFIDTPLIATSANSSGEPIIFKTDILEKKLSKVYDFILDNDREIITPSDDSLTFISKGKSFFLRTSRGINPSYIDSGFKAKGTFLSLGAEMKNQFCLYKDGLIINSPYIGDLKNVATFERFMDMVDKFTKFYDLKIDAIIADKHPNFIHTKHFESLGFEIFKVQHHYAHLMSSAFENGLFDKNLGNNEIQNFLGFAFDGTGYGDNGSIWGGEVMEFNSKNYDRIYHFDEFFLLGGEKSIKEISRLKYAIFKKYGLDIKDDNALNFMLKSRVNSPLTSSLGRIFDAFACLVFDLKRVSYDGEAGGLVEKFYDKKVDDFYDFKLENGKITFKDPFLKAKNETKTLACSKFINGIVEMIIKIYKERKNSNDSKNLVFSGGVFQNQTLVNALLNRLESKNLQGFFNEKIPANDGGVALGGLVSFLYSKF